MRPHDAGSGVIGNAILRTRLRILLAITFHRPLSEGMFRFLFVFLCSCALATAVDLPKNIVLIMADDLGIEGLGCYGGTSYSTPNLDRMAADGLRFTRAYSQPLCTPTRLEIMTGRYNQRNWQSFGILPKGERTFGHLMQAFGYKTCISGKWQLTSYDPPDFPGAEKRRGTGTPPDQAGFDAWSLHHARHTEDKGSRYANPTFERNGELHRDVMGAYGEDLSVDFLLDFMKAHRDEPMFIYYPMALPHWPMTPTPDSRVWENESRRLEESTEYFPDMVAYMDKMVGRVIDGIAGLELATDTLILFYSDNGTDRRITSDFRGQPIPGGKGEPTQNGIRVPLIARWPGHLQPGVCDDLVDPSDFVPTLADLAEKPLPQDWNADGVSFAPRLLGTTPKPRDWCFFWYDPRPGWDKDKFGRHIFALDTQFKLFSDGRLYRIDDEGFKEELLDSAALDEQATAAQAKLRSVIDDQLSGPLSETAVNEVDAFGNPVQ